MKIGDKVIALIHERVMKDGIPQCTGTEKKPVPAWNRTEQEAVVENIIERSQSFFNVTVLIGEDRYHLREENIKPIKGAFGF